MYALLRAALATVHRDPRWWQKILIGGVLMTTLIGLPFAAGLVMESLENTRRGYPTPLPPWHDWSARYLIGIFTLLIDVTFYGLPLLVGAFLTFCISTAIIASSSGDTHLFVVASTAVALLMLYWLSIFLCSVVPVARLIYAQEGRIEDALGMAPLRRALSSQFRRVCWRARLASLPVSIPTAVCVLLTFLVAGSSFPGSGLVVLVLVWLAMSALLYAHLVMVQIYAAAEREAMRV